MENQFANEFEKFPGSRPEVSAERLEASKNWELAMEGKTGAPVAEFSGDRFGIANEQNNYYGESVADEEAENEYDDGSAIKIIYTGLDGAARERGVEAVVKTLRDYDPNGSKNPIGDLFVKLGIDTNKGIQDVNEREQANSWKMDEASREISNQPRAESAEEIIKAIKDMQELITEVEGANPRYESLRQGARAAGMGYFEYAVKDYNTRGLTELFQVLAAQREEAAPAVEEEKEDKDKTEEAEEEFGFGVGPGGDAETDEKEVNKEDDKNEEDFANRERLNPEILK